MNYDEGESGSKESRRENQDGDFSFFGKKKVWRYLQMEKWKGVDLMVLWDDIEGNERETLVAWRRCRKEEERVGWLKEVSRGRRICWVDDMLWRWGWRKTCFQWETEEQLAMVRWWWTKKKNSHQKRKETTFFSNSLFFAFFL